ncbi:NUDIX hydrolase [Cereibacter sphaeroides]|uniref:NUDIX hydrolase n=1 Tax=Cereibacter sphaeroides TaxID=1063 RepID=UPI001F25AEA9|nr:NUDIX hydrolase [Cereibacter sphaeroides]MCE6958801.1 NUDIX hydrolase [Cereibacter sphaeroides]MCE6973325.1 NUDIX hydrolase [Cereibacter sphaeroides]
MPDYTNPIATVDAVILTLEQGRLKIMLARRAAGPFQGALALPGGYVHPEEDRSLADAVRRILRGKCGVDVAYMEQLETFSGPDRDPRGWSISVAHIALVPRDALPVETEERQFHDVDDLPDLAFDHAEIVAAALRRLRGKGAYSTLPAAFLGESFTLPEMQRAYEAVLGERLNLAAFRRKVMDWGLVEDTGEKDRSTDRPAALYRLAEPFRTLERSLRTAA